MPDHPFRTTKNFEAAAAHISKYCKISVQLASKRLHDLKAFRGIAGNHNVIFDLSGGVYIEVGKRLEYVGSLTTGGAKESV